MTDQHTAITVTMSGPAARVLHMLTRIAAHAARKSVSLLIMPGAHTSVRTPATHDEGRGVLARIAPAHTATFDAALACFEEEMKLAGRDPLHTRRTLRYVRDLRARCAWNALSDIRAEHVRAWLSDAAADGCSAKTRNTRRGYISRFCRFCVAQGWLASSPVDGVGKARVVARKARIVPTEEQVAALILAAKRAPRGFDRWLVYLTAATTGLRWGTLKALDWAHVRLDEFPPRLEIPGHLLKGRAPGTVYLPAETAELLGRHRGPRPRRGKVFRSVPKPTTFIRDLRRAKLERGVPGEGPTFSFHSLRHFASNRMRWAGQFTDAERAAQNTHATVATTRGVYTDPAHKNFGERVNQLQPLLGQRLAQGGGGARKPPAPKNLLDNGGARRHTDTAQMVKTPEQHEHASPAGSARSGPSEQCPQGTYPAGSLAFDLSSGTVSGAQGDRVASIGVSGFEPPALTVAARITEQALILAENAVRALRAGFELWRPDAGPADSGVRDGPHR